MKSATSVIVIALLMIATECMAWGQKGHDTTCAIAERHLSRSARRHVKRVLDGQSLVYWSNWLDNASHQPQYAYSLSWHYKDIDANETYDEVAPAANGDIVTALTAQIEKLKNGNLNHDEEALALKMVIHFVGDLHQPLHLGHKDDLGGNELKVKFFGNETNLHTVWDTDLVEAAHKWSYTEWMEQIDRADKKEQRRMASGTIDDWARETHNLATEVYAKTPAGTNISYDYVAEASPIIERQLLRAGLRLARILNEIY